MALDLNFVGVLESGNTFCALVKDSSTQRAFRSALALGSPELDAYLSSETIMGDIVRILVSTGTYQPPCLLRAPENNPAGIFDVVNVLKATNLPHTLVRDCRYDFADLQDAFLSDAILDEYFTVLDGTPGNFPNPDYFYKLLLHLIQMHTGKMFEYISSHPNVVGKLVNHLSVSSVCQILAGMVRIEKHMRDVGDTDVCQWTEKTCFVRKLLDLLEQQPLESFENVHKILIEFTEDKTGESARDFVLLHGNALVSTLLKLLSEKPHAISSVLLLEETILSTISANYKISEAMFCTRAKKLLYCLSPIISRLLKSNSVIFTLCAVKAVHALVKNSLAELIPFGIIQSIRNMSRFPLSNVLHNAVKDILTGILAPPPDDYDPLIEEQAPSFVLELAWALTSEKHCYRGHIYSIVAAFETTPTTLREKLKSSPVYDTLIDSVSSNDCTKLKELLESHPLPALSEPESIVSEDKKEDADAESKREEDAVTESAQNDAVGEVGLKEAIKGDREGQPEESKEETQNAETTVEGQ